MSLNAVTPSHPDAPRAETPRLARWAVGGAVAALMATAALLWWSQGSKVFLDTLAAGLAWCF
ncbi:hypothetical protein [Phreatobacter sp.]|uniref:hypothetical protein n=1 Tax=Phreatobacter sp. TaxID=1966341 RepID=UPI003F6FA26C